MKLAIATCESPPVPDTDAERLIPALGERELEAEPVVWTDPAVDWASYGLVWISSTWDYHRRGRDFIAWLRRVAGRTRVENPPALIEWNLDKRYLWELEEAGVPVVPTVWVEPGGGGSAVHEVAQRRWTEVVVKPAVDLGASRLERTSATRLRAAVDRIEGNRMVQPYLDSLESEGELSLVYLAGELSHAVRKRPAQGDFRVQEQYGGGYGLTDPGADASAIGAATMAAIGARVARSRRDSESAPLYARVDLVRGPDGGLCLIELELIEPSLYLHVVDGAGTERLADLLAETMQSA